LIVTSIPSGTTIVTIPTPLERDLPGNSRFRVANMSHAMSVSNQKLRPGQIDVGYSSAEALQVNWRQAWS
jgi:hypothetical protein